MVVGSNNRVTWDSILIAVVYLQCVNILRVLLVCNCCCCYRLVGNGRSDVLLWPQLTARLQRSALVEGCYLSGVDRPICYGLRRRPERRRHWLLGGRPSDRLMWQLSVLWVGTSSGSLAIWRYAGDWWYRRWMEGQLPRRCLRSGWIGAIWFAGVAFDTS